MGYENESQQYDTCTVPTNGEVPCSKTKHSAHGAGARTETTRVQQERLHGTDRTLTDSHRANEHNCWWNLRWWSDGKSSAYTPGTRHVTRARKFEGSVRLYKQHDL